MKREVVKTAMEMEKIEAFLHDKGRFVGGDVQISITDLAAILDDYIPVRKSDVPEGLGKALKDCKPSAGNSVYTCLNSYIAMHKAAALLVEGD